MLLYQCQDISWDMPNYGSNDGALIYPVTSCFYRDFRPVINTIIAMLTGKQLYDVDKHQEELIWFSGKNPEDYPIKKIDSLSSEFGRAGIFTLRKGTSMMMLIANDYCTRPAHMDQNHIDLWVDEINVLCDAGTYSYASTTGQSLIMNSAHNTAEVQDMPQMNLRGSFMVYGWTKRVKIMHSDAYLESIVKSKNGYVHHRKVECFESGYIVTDNVDKNYVLCFHTTCKVELRNGRAILRHGDKICCTLTTSGKISIETATRSLYYLTKENVLCIKIRGIGSKNTMTKIFLGEKEIW